jgi:metallophosphoesterase superfamily enzyme
MKPTSLAVDIAWHPPLLSSLCSCFDLVQRCLFVADVHFGKDAMFRARGIPVPAGSTTDNLMRLDILITEFEPIALVFPGDGLPAFRSLRGGAVTKDVPTNRRFFWSCRSGGLGWPDGN